MNEESYNVQADRTSQQADRTSQQADRTSHIGLIVILGLLSMLMPLAIDMYLPAMPLIASEFGVGAGSVQMTLSAYVLGFSIGQLFYGPLADSLGRKPVIL